MKKHNFWKRTAAGILALCLVFGATPMTGMQTVFEMPSIVAKALPPGNDTPGKLYGYVTVPGATAPYVDSADNTLLHLAGSVTSENINTALSGTTKNAITKIVADEGTVLPTNCLSLFKDYSSVTLIDLSKADTSQVTNMSNMFDSCTSLEKLDLSNFKTDNVSNMVCSSAAHPWRSLTLAALIQVM